MDTLKQAAAQEALKHVQSGMSLGLGTGSTVYFFLLALGKALGSGRLKDIRGVPSSIQTQKLAQSLSIPLIPLEGRLDLYVDGADILFPDGWLVKGGGGALLREKIVAQASDKHVIIADYTKCAPLGDTFKLPIEIIDFGHVQTTKIIQTTLQATQPAEPALQLSDNGNRIMTFFCPSTHNLIELNVKLNDTAGIVDHGLFYLPNAVRHISFPK